MFASGGIDAILTCLPQFKASVLKDSLLARKLSWSVVAFADRPWVVSPYGPVGEWEPPTELPSSGGTAMGTAVIEALRLRGEHLKAQAARGIATHRSFGFLLSDGEPTGEPAERVEEAAGSSRRGKAEATCRFFCLAVERSQHRNAEASDSAPRTARDRPGRLRALLQMVIYVHEHCFGVPARRAGEAPGPD